MEVNDCLHVKHVCLRCVFFLFLFFCAGLGKLAACPQSFKQISMSKKGEEGSKTMSTRTISKCFQDETVVQATCKEMHEEPGGSLHSLLQMREGWGAVCVGHEALLQSPHVRRRCLHLPWSLQGGCSCGSSIPTLQIISKTIGGPGWSGSAG